MAKAIGMREQTGVLTKRTIKAQGKREAARIIKRVRSLSAVKTMKISRNFNYTTKTEARPAFQPSHVVSVAPAYQRVPGVALGGSPR